MPTELLLHVEVVDVDKPHGQARATNISQAKDADRCHLQYVGSVKRVFCRSWMSSHPETDVVMRDLVQQLLR